MLDASLALTRSCSESQPPDHLRHAIDALWIDRSSSSTAAQIKAIVADGCVDLIGQQAADGQFSLFVNGVDSRGKFVNIEPGTSYVGVRFKPGVARLLLRIDVPDLRDSQVAATEFPVLRALNDHVRAETSFDRVAGHFLEFINRHDAHDTLQVPYRVLDALERLRSTSAHPRLEEVARTIGVTERTLHRDVLAWTGVSPNLFARIHRFQRAKRLISVGGRALTDAAYLCGFADQAHMTREFHRFAAQTPALLGGHV